MVMLNDMDRFHLVIDVIDRVPGLATRAAAAASGDARRPARSPRVHASVRRRSARTSATGCGRADASSAVARPRRQRWFVEPEAARYSTRSDEVVAENDGSPDDVDALTAFVDGCGRRSTLSGIASSTVATDLVEPCRHRRRRHPRDRSADPAGAVAPTGRGRGHPSLQRLVAGVPAVACFDTAFHATISPAARDLCVAARSGASGSACGDSASTACRMRTHRDTRSSSPAIPIHRLVTCHLGAGSSHQRDRRRSLRRHDDGVHHRTRAYRWRRGPAASTSGMIMWLLDAGLDHAEVADALQHRSGLLGLRRHRGHARGRSRRGSGATRAPPSRSTCGRYA